MAVEEFILLHFLTFGSSHLVPSRSLVLGPWFMFGLAPGFVDESGALGRGSRGYEKNTMKKSWVQKDHCFLFGESLDSRSSSQIQPFKIALRVLHAKAADGALTPPL